jgi:hypothetical protein
MPSAVPGVCPGVMTAEAVSKQRVFQFAPARSGGVKAPVEGNNLPTRLLRGMAWLYELMLWLTPLIEPRSPLLREGKRINSVSC